MNIALKPEQERFIKSQIDKGRFKSADEAVSQAFRLLEEKERDYENWIEGRRDEIAQDARESLAEFRSGKLRATTATEAIAELREFLSADPSDD